MSEHNKAGEARKGLIDSVKGKAKEIAGAVTGNDSLTAEGQLEQSQANERKEANTVEAVADAEAAQAHAEATAARVEGAQERTAVNAQTAAAQTSIRHEQAAEKRAAEQAGRQRATLEKTRAELDALAKTQRAEAKEHNEIDSAAAEVGEAVEDHLTAAHAASTAKAEADRIRRQAEQLTNKADLP
ncbi:CsbD family protein [Mycobacterium sp. MMS18-G62]